MSKLVIIGAGGFGREVLAWARTAMPDQEVKGFLDDNPSIERDARLRVPMLGPLDRHVPAPDELFVCAIGNPAARRAAVEKIKGRGGRFVSLIHPTAVVAEGAHVGVGAIICPFALISVDAQVGDGSVVYYHSSVDHDAIIGAWVQISGHCDIMGGATIGEEVFLGSHAAVFPRVDVGARAVIGAGAVVIRSVPADATVVGVPARPAAHR